MMFRLLATFPFLLSSFYSVTLAETCKTFSSSRRIIKYSMYSVIVPDINDHRLSRRKPVVTVGVQHVWTTPIFRLCLFIVEECTAVTFHSNYDYD